MTNETAPDLAALDRRLIWHPFTQHANDSSPILIERAKGASLFTPDGREILDLISSWWTSIHGHAHPQLNAAIAEQAAKLDHVMFAGFTHEGAIRLADALTSKLGHGLERVFFSDDGSTAVEVALKIAYQYWANIGDARRRLFLSFEHGYHGDTVGAMSLSRGAGFFSLFDGLMFEVRTVPYAATHEDDAEVGMKEDRAIEMLAKQLQQCGHEVAALIIEPLLQGAGGMRLCRGRFVRRVVELARKHGVLVIFDEVATGFGRTGTLFAFEQCSIAPDIICLSKGLTAGYLPMSVTVARSEIFEAFKGTNFDKALAHGHSFTANPLSCAVALRSLQLFEEEGTLARIATIEATHRAALPRLQAHEMVAKARVRGTVLAFDLVAAPSGYGRPGYGSEQSRRLREWYLAHGFNIRPLGNSVYLLPPYCITDAELERAYDGLLAGLDWLAGAG
jgi:adenosylmethionine-8-amino-7-oxononanoate aminotransferase